MVEIGYSLSSEEHRPLELVDLAVRAERAGFRFALISDHFHPWTHHQGESPFVWAVIGGIARATTCLRLGTGVTCPLIRMHPAIVAQAAATAASMMPGRFFLGVGSGENLNEHVTGARWPTPGERLAMLEEAVAILRLLWRGGTRSHRGRYYVVDEARIYTLPEAPIPIYMAAGGAKSLALAGRIADGLVATTPDAQLIERFAAAGGVDKPRYGHLTICWAHSDDEARRTAREWWPNGALEGELTRELKTPTLIQNAVAPLTEEAMARELVCGPDRDRHVDAIRQFERAGYDHVYVHQVGPDQEGFVRFYERDVLPVFA
jgi:G6PDH family F420-dependent oxidoreductase